MAVTLEAGHVNGALGLAGGTVTAVVSLGLTLPWNHAGFSLVLDYGVFLGAGLSGWSSSGGLLPDLNSLAAIRLDPGKGGYFWPCEGGGYHPSKVLGLFALFPPFGFFWPLGPPFSHGKGRFSGVNRGLLRGYSWPL